MIDRDTFMDTIQAWNMLTIGIAEIVSMVL